MKKSKTKKLYYAVSARGQGVVFTSKPSRSKKIGVWIGHIEGCYSSVVDDMEREGYIVLPKLTFSDEPVELRLTLEYG